jgi:hypothetical protein
MAPEWQAAMEALILVATRGGPVMFARIGVMRALNRRFELAQLKGDLVAIEQACGCRGPAVCPFWDASFSCCCRHGLA